MSHSSGNEVQHATDLLPPALIKSSPARYERAANEARLSGFEPHMVQGIYGTASRCLSPRVRAAYNLTVGVQRDILVHNTMLNMIEGHRKAAKIVIERNVSHTVFEDDFLLATSRNEVQSYLAERVGKYDYVPLGGCLVDHRDPTSGQNQSRSSGPGVRFTCGHAGYMSPKFARAYLEMTESCHNVMLGLDGPMLGNICDPAMSDASPEDPMGIERSMMSFRKRHRVRCADWSPMLRFYQGGGWLPDSWDRRCSQCCELGSMPPSWHAAKLFPNPLPEGDIFRKQCVNGTRSKRWVSDRHGWVGFGHFVQDRVGVKPHLHDSQNRARKTGTISNMVRFADWSIANASLAVAQNTSVDP